MINLPYRMVAELRRWPRFYQYVGPPSGLRQALAMLARLPGTEYVAGELHGQARVLCTEALGLPGEMRLSAVNGVAVVETLAKQAEKVRMSERWRDLLGLNGDG
jgi:hypothetical protein